MKLENLEAERIFEACARVGDDNMFSVDYIIACCEYENFYKIMKDYKVIM
jgi:hypothetical protein